MEEAAHVAGGTDGWLRVKREPGGVIAALPELISVVVTDRRAGREYFVAMEGVERHNRFSVQLGNLRTGTPGYLGAAGLQFSLSAGRLTYPGGVVGAITGADRPIPLGRHPIQIPDFPHAAGGRYAGQSLFAKTWFYLGSGPALPGRNDRYLHTGRESDGCVTVDPVGWTALYKRLISSRSGNGATVGAIEVVR